MYSAENNLFFPVSQLDLPQLMLLMQFQFYVF